MPGSRTLLLCEAGLAIGRGPGTELWNCEGVMTLLNRLVAFATAKLLESGCHVRLRQASSAALLIESRREKTVDVGDAITLMEGESGLDTFMEAGPKRGRFEVITWGDWKGFPADEGTLSRRPGVRDPVYML